MASHLGLLVLLSVLAVGFCMDCDATLNYTHKDGNKTVASRCLDFNVTMSLDVTYPNGTKKSKASFDCTNFTFDNNNTINTCNSTSKKAHIVFMVEEEEGIAVAFSISGDKNQWQISQIEAIVNDTSLLPDSTIKNESLQFLKTKSSDIIGKVDYKRSYYCNSGRTIKLSPNNTASKNFSMSLKVSHFHVQAFKFKSEKPYKYDESARCSQDIKGSKIVPIAVGAALAGLVIIVLIAYIIGRLRSRKQSSYEALS